MSQFPFELTEHSLRMLPTGTVKNTVDTLGKRIARSTYPVGATLPLEVDLVECLGVSRTVVREAIKVLCGKGMVRTARRYGSVVQAYKHWNLLDPDVIRWHDRNSPMAAQLYCESNTLRQLIEPEAASIAAVKATKEQRANMLNAAYHISPAEFGLEGTVAADFAFHSTILEATGNHLFGQMRSMVLAILQFIYEAETKDDIAYETSRQAHIALARAIGEGDAEGARALMSQMMEWNPDLLPRFPAWRDADPILCTG